MEKTNQILAHLGLQKKLYILKYVKEWKSVNKTPKLFRIPKSTYYKWKKAFDKDGENGLLRKHPVVYSHPNKIKENIIEKVLSLRKEYQPGSWRIKWYLERYHDI
jgi:transposase